MCRYNQAKTRSFRWALIQYGQQAWKKRKLPCEDTDVPGKPCDDRQSVEGAAASDTGNWEGDMKCLCRPFWRARLCQHLHLGLQSPEVWEDERCLKPPSVWSHVTLAPGNWHNAQSKIIFFLFPFAFYIQSIPLSCIIDPASSQTHFLLPFQHHCPSSGLHDFSFWILYVICFSFCNLAPFKSVLHTAVIII